MAPRFKYSDEFVETFLQGIFSGEINEYEIPETLYKAIADYLKEGLYKGFGGDLVDFGGKDLELLNELRSNVYMFSAAKSYQQIKEIGSLMFDENGDRISIGAFSKLGKESFATWNDDYGRTEYNTAVGQATMANKWTEVERNKDLLPILVFDTKGKACPECAPYEGFSAPVDDPKWKWLMPLLHFNCACTVRQEEKGYPLSSKEENDRVDGMKENVPEVFRNNAGIDKEIFSAKHPYFDVPKKDREYAANNFNLPIPSKD